MSEPTGDSIPALGGDPAAEPTSMAADNTSGGTTPAAPPTNNATSINFDVAKEAPASTEIIVPSNNSADPVVKNKEAVAEAATVVSAPTHDMSHPHDQAVEAPAPTTAAATTTATINDSVAPAVEDNANSNGAAAPIIKSPEVVADSNAKSDAAATTAVDTSRNSPMNILAEIASVESISGEEQDNKKNDDAQMKDVGETIASDAMQHNDIILSLKDDTYKTIMYQYFRQLEEKKIDGVRNEEEESKVKDEVYELLKNAGGRLLTYVDHRKPGLGFIHVDEETARSKIDNHISRRDESKSVWDMNAAASPKKHAPRNIFLSLKDDYYRENLFKYFRKLGTKVESQRDSDEEKNVKDEAYEFFKASGGKLVQHNNWKRPELGHYEVDEEYARKKISDDIRRRLESKDRWDADEDGASNANDGDGLVDLHKLAQIASGEDEEQLPVSKSRSYNHAATKVMNKPSVERDQMDLDESHNGKYSYLDIYTLEYLKTWMTMPSHIEDPYPTDEDNARIIKDTGISKSALYNWFVSTRSRKWKPAINKIRSKYGIDNTTPLAQHMKDELAGSIFPANENAAYLDGVFSEHGMSTDAAMKAKRKYAVLPQPWEEHFDNDTNYYYYHNPETGAVQWKHPAFGGDEHKVAQTAATKPSSVKKKPPKELFSAEDLKKTAKFNVAGNLFEVLCSSLPNSQESRIAQTAQASIRGDVSIPIARDVELFSICVRFLRKGKADLPGNVPRKVFLEELDYFGIPYELDHRNTIRNPTFYTKPDQTRSRKKTCGSCPNCLREDCRECVMCLDMVKYGGPGVKRQRCLERWCMQTSPPTSATKASKKKKEVGRSKGLAKATSPSARKEETSWEDELAKIQAELNRKAEEAGKGGKTFGLTNAVSKKPSRSSSRNADRKRQRMASETSGDDDDTITSGKLQSVGQKEHDEYSKMSTSTGRTTSKRNAAGHIKVAAYGAIDTSKATVDVQKRYDDAQKKRRSDAPDLPMVRGVTVRPSGKWQVQYYYCGSSRYIGVFKSKQDALVAYETAREILGKTDSDSLTKEQILNNINLARNAAFSTKDVKYIRVPVKNDSVAQQAEQKLATKPTARQKKISENEAKQAVAMNELGHEKDVDIESKTDMHDDGRYSIKRCSAMACDEVAVFGDRCIAHRPMCSTRGCQKRVHSDGKCKSHLTSSRQLTSSSRSMAIPFGVGYKFRKQFEGDLFEGEVIEVLSGGGNDRRCKYLIDGFIEDLSTADLKLLAQSEIDNPVELGNVGYRFRKQFNDGWYDGIVVKVLKRGANGKDRRVHYSADDDFEDLSLDDLRMLVSLDTQACDTCRSRMIYCDGTQPFCLNMEPESVEVEPEVEEAIQSESEEENVENRSRRNRSSSSRAGSKRSSSQKVRSKERQEDDPVDSFQPSDNDMILSLKDDLYKATLFKTFRKLGPKKESEREKEEERQAKIDVFNYFKNAGVRFVKHINYRKPDLGVIEADDAYARDKINSDISRRLESMKRWAGEFDDESSEDDAPVQNLKHRPRVIAKRPNAAADAEESSSDEAELEQYLVEQDESKRRKLNEKCSVHGSSCDIYEALDIAQGWFVHIVPRKNGQHSPDKFFFSPTGEKFRSFISVKRFVEKNAPKSSSDKKRKRAASPAESVDSSFHNDICECCGGLGELLCCSTCNLVYHLECTRPVLSELPEGDWSCAFCVAAGTGIGNSEPPLTKTEAVQGVKDIEALKKQSFQDKKRRRTS